MDGEIYIQQNTWGRKDGFIDENQTKPKQATKNLLCN